MKFVRFTRFVIYIIRCFCSSVLLLTIVEPMTPEEAAAAAAAEIAGEAVEGSVPAGSTEGSAPPTEGLLIFYWLFHFYTV